MSFQLLGCYMSAFNMEKTNPKSLPDQEEQRLFDMLHAGHPGLPLSQIYYALGNPHNQRGPCDVETLLIRCIQELNDGLTESPPLETPTTKPVDVSNESTFVHG